MNFVCGQLHRIVSIPRYLDSTDIRHIKGITILLFLGFILSFIFAISVRQFEHAEAETTQNAEVEITQNDDGSIVQCKTGVIDPNIGDVYGWKDSNPFNDSGLLKIVAIREGWYQFVFCKKDGTTRWPKGTDPEAEKLDNLCRYKKYEIKK